MEIIFEDDSHLKDIQEKIIVRLNFRVIHKLGEDISSKLGLVITLNIKKFFV